ncbi:hypothetical protein [Elizabethkingia sp. JS20170427COW]|uniref:hypothetical protein n=1 Tax=Elizabethkingia sp. JS20170427COW TaxID=2583851 RepID=UPI0011105A05|nr:hypothetical protein [Elizabethkingia sp. JS20170427COW]QCX53523.1 hypothetical protein FGE20_07165 [Elizabethkingia sp. JS20170427COW]
MKNKTFKIILLIFSFLFFSHSCSNREETVSCFPIQNISLELNLNLPAYYKLNNVGGWIYVNEVGAGNRGLIIVRSTTGFIAYDRNAPHLCPDGDNTILKVVDNIKIVCPKDDAEWILLTGQPTKVAKVNPKIYRVIYNSNMNTISIYN